MGQFEVFTVFWWTQDPFDAFWQVEKQFYNHKIHNFRLNANVYSECLWYIFYF